MVLSAVVAVFETNSRTYAVTESLGRVQENARVAFELISRDIRESSGNACERDLRPSVIQRKVTNGYRAMWAAQGEAAIRTVVDTARLTPGATVFRTILATVSA